MPCFQDREDRTDYTTALEHIVPGNRICWVSHKCEFLFFCLLFDRKSKEKEKKKPKTRQPPLCFSLVVFQNKTFVVQASGVFF